MTNEAAIDVLKEICIKNSYTGYPFEALSMAIEALEKIDKIKRYASELETLLIALRL